MTKLPFEMTAAEFVEQLRRNVTAAVSMIPQEEIQNVTAKVTGLQLDVATVYAEAFDSFVSQAKEQVSKFNFAK